MTRKKFFCLLIVLALMILAMCSCSNGTVDNSTGQPDESADMNGANMPEPLPEFKPYNILFIGHSYTYYNDMPKSIFAKIASAAGYIVNVDTITKGSYTLQKFADPTDMYGKKVDETLKGRKSFDYVILQEQSTIPIRCPLLFYSAVQSLQERIELNGAKSVLYSTWAIKNGNYKKLTWQMAAPYSAIGAELNIPVAYAGLAFHDIRASGHEIELYNEDLQHPSYEGSYLAAMTLVATIFNVDPTTIEYDGKLTPETAVILREAARKVVFETPPIPEEYVISSEEVAQILGLTRASDSEN